jgi:phage terminase small subunit
LKLTPKQKAFADAYIETGNASEAMRRAGYSEKNVNVTGSQNLANPSVSAYIKERMAELEAQRVASADEVMRFFSSVMRGEVKDQFGLDASLQDRLNAGKELMKRYAAVHDRESTNEAKIILAADGGIEVDDGR